MAPNCDPRPPQPWTRYTTPAGRAVSTTLPHTVPRTTCPCASTSNGSPPSGTGRSAILGGAENHSSRATRATRRGARCSPYRKKARPAAFLSSTLVLFWFRSMAGLVSFGAGVWGGTWGGLRVVSGLVCRWTVYEGTADPFRSASTGGEQVVERPPSVLARLGVV